MPHAIRRVVVARSARIAASLAVIVAGTALLATAAAPTFATWLARGLPGIQPAVLSTLLGAAWIVGLCVYAIARARVEHRFAVAMSRYVLPGNDLDQDIERLDHEHPDEAARQMAHGLEVSSATLPVIAAAFVLPATGIYVLHAIALGGWPVVSEFEASLVANAHTLIGIGLAGVVAGVVMTRRSARLPSVTPIAGALAVVVFLCAITLHHPWLLALTTILTAASFVTHRLRIERVLIATEDPAAGSELFTLRGFARRVRATLALIMRMVGSRRQAMQVTVALLAVVAGGAFYQRRHHQDRVTTTRAAAVAAHRETVQPAPNDFLRDYAFSRTPDDRLQLDFDLDGARPFVLPSMSELDVLPKNWRASLRFELVSAAPGPLTVSAFGLSRTIDFNAPTQDLTTEACDDALRFAITFEAATASPGTHHVTLYVTPRLDVAHCQ